MHPRTVAAAVTVFASLASSPSAHALCVRPVVNPEVITTDVTTSNGGILVGTVVGHDGAERGDPADQKWELSTKTGKVTPKMISLAPGLVVLGLPDKIDGAELLDGKTVIAKLARSKTAIAKLAAPVAKRIGYTSTPGRRGNSERTSVTFAEKAIPAGAVALVVVDAKTSKPRSYGLVQSGSSEVTVYAHGRCSGLPNGTMPTVAGDKVILRWVDNTGAISADSKPITVAKD